MREGGIAVKPAMVVIGVLLFTIVLAGILNPQLRNITGTVENMSDESDNPVPGSIWKNLDLVIVLVPIIIVVLIVVYFIAKALFFEEEYQTFSRAFKGGERTVASHTQTF